ncbi:MAG: putative branched-chain amino acid transporter, amino acid-binding protein [Pseudonocardiales bacterium]|nr:putative branched-chain amino acid transporter, amino acid-binding protein [Pseudonocardiales bacterium]
MGVVRLSGWFAGGVAGLLILSACSSGGGSPVEAGSSSVGTTDSVFGRVNAASGSAITVAINMPGKSESFDATASTLAAKAAAKYANDYLGGIHGHVIKVTSCDTRLDPATQTDCAHQAVSANASVVVEATGDDNTVGVLAAANIPLFAGTGATPALLSSAGSFTLGNALGAFGGPAIYAKQQGYARAALIINDLPVGTVPAKTFGVPYFKNAGAALDVIPVPVGTADMSPQVAVAEGQKPQLYYVVGAPSFCTSAIRAIKAAAPTTPILMNSCITTGPTGIPGGYAGLKTVTNQAADPGDKDYQLFLAVQKKYAGSTESLGLSGYVPMLGLIRALNAATLADTSPASVTAAIKTAPAVALPASEGSTFKCDGTALPAISKNICSLATFIADTDKAGNTTNYKVLDDPTIYRLG